jgi:hypothetical protein
VVELDEALEESLDMELPGSAKELRDLEDRVVHGIDCPARESWLAEVVEAVVGHTL